MDYKKISIYIFITIILSYIIVHYLNDKINYNFPTIKNPLDDESSKKLRLNNENENENESLLYINNKEKYDMNNKNFEYPKSVRTDPSIEYNYISNDKSIKYFMFSPSGGYANQLVELESAILIAHFLNRTLLVPMCGRHTNGWGNYDRLDLDELYPFDKLLDFRKLKEYGVPIVPLNITIRMMHHYINHNYPAGQLHILRDDTKMKKMDVHDVKKWNHSYKARFLFVTGKGMYHRWFPTPLYVHLKKYIRPSKFIRDYAILASQLLGGAGTYNSVHIRRGDYLHNGKTPDAEQWLKKLHTFHFKRNTKLYIATEPGKGSSFFRPIHKQYKYVVYSRNLNSELVHSFKRNFPESTRGDMLGLLEQLICVAAHKFLGSNYSTFSSLILFTRKHIEFLFPELIGVINHDNDPLIQHHEHYSTDNNNNNITNDDDIKDYLKIDHDETLASLEVENNSN